MIRMLSLDSKVGGGGTLVIDQLIPKVLILPILIHGLDIILTTKTVKSLNVHR